MEEDAELVEVGGEVRAGNVVDLKGADDPEPVEARDRPQRNLLEDDGPV
jgi:hypothetical protein